MDAREWVLTKHLRAHDSELYCRRHPGSGVYCVYRKAVRWEDYLWEGGILRFSRPSKNLCFALTDTWQITGKPIDWGIEPVLERAKETHFSRNEERIEELIRSYQRAEESRARQLSNEAECFLTDFRRQFARTFNDINTSTLEKVDRRRQFNGHHK